MSSQSSPDFESSGAFDIGHGLLISFGHDELGQRFLILARKGEAEPVCGLPRLQNTHCCEQISTSLVTNDTHSLCHVLDLRLDNDMYLGIACTGKCHSLREFFFALWSSRRHCDSRHTNNSTNGYRETEDDLVKSEKP
jgi:hypothetical protein